MEQPPIQETRKGTVMEKTLAIHLTEQREQIAREIENKIGCEDAAEIARGVK